MSAVLPDARPPHGDVTRNPARLAASVLEGNARFQWGVVNIEMEFFPHPSLQIHFILSTVTWGVWGPQVERLWQEGQGECSPYSGEATQPEGSLQTSPVPSLFRTRGPVIPGRPLERAPLGRTPGPGANFPDASGLPTNGTPVRGVQDRRSSSGGRG